MRRYLSYSGYNIYTTCPSRYRRQYIDREKAPDNKARNVFGMGIGTMLEYFYNEKLFKKPEAASILASRVEKVILDIEADNEVNWSNPWNLTRADVKLEILEHIPRMIAIIKQHKLIGAYAESEVKLHGWSGEWQLGSRADLIFTQGGQVVIIDGKGSKWGDRYVDPDQLYFYALLYYQEHEVLPVRLGWLLFRFEGDDSVSWVDPQPRNIKLLRDKLVKVLARIDGEDFEATPSSNACRFCPYVDKCEPKDQHSAKYKARRKSKPKPPIGPRGDIVTLDL